MDGQGSECGPMVGAGAQVCATAHSDTGLIQRLDDLILAGLQTQS